MTVRAKFYVASKTDFGDKMTVDLVPVCSGSEENKQFWQYTPSGHINLQIVNRPAAEQLIVGKQYYIDFTPAD